MRATTASPRKLISVLAPLGLLALAAPPTITPRPTMAAADNPITIENQADGTDGWELVQQGDDVSQQIKGYASLTSVPQGGSRRLYVTANPAQSYNIDFYRFGWINGTGGRLEPHSGPLTAISQPASPR